MFGRVRRKSDERGQGLVEVAIAMPFLLLLLVGIAGFGRAFNVKQVLTNAAREGARAAAVLPVRSSTEALESQAAEVRQVVLDYLSPANIHSPEQLDITGLETGTGNPVTVVVGKDFDFFLIGSIRLESTAVMRRE